MAESCNVSLRDALACDLTFLLNESVGLEGLATSAGHAAIYLSNVCGNQDIGLRMCQNGEPGIVLSSYPNFGFGKKYQWMAVPLTYYLYANETGNPPDVFDRESVIVAQDVYRNRLFKNEPITGQTWSKMVGVAYTRSLIAFKVTTTAEEDRNFIRKMNARQNVSHFNLFWHNCADFAASVLNSYFPGSGRRDWINDFGITTPKALARSLSIYAKQHPERTLAVSRIEQVPGSSPRSCANRNFTEQAFHSPKFLAIEAVVNPPLIGAFAATYYFGGHRFNPNQGLPTRRVDVKCLIR